MVSFNSIQVARNKGIPYRLYTIMFLVLTFCMCYKVSAQTEMLRAKNWFFGDKISLKFGATVAADHPDGAMQARNGCASISSTTGDLLFYTNGEKIWNKNHLPMQNGEDLLGNDECVQSVLILPNPGTLYPNRYYVLYVSTDYVCYYTEVDMSANGGLGAVNISKKNVAFEYGVAESITACRHANGRDIWLVVHGRAGSAFAAYLITESGLTPGASYYSVLRFAGKSFSNETTSMYSPAPGKSEHVMKLSPDGKYIATTLRQPGRLDGYVEVFNFDNVSGAIDPNFREYAIFNPYGVEFSPNGKFLYVTATGLPSGAYVFQIDLTTREVWNYRISDHCYIGSIQLAPDGKIYFVYNNSCFNYSGTQSFIIGLIRSPNEKGARCNIEPQPPSMVLSQPIESPIDVEKYSLPNFLTSFFDPNITTVSRCDDCINDSTAGKVAWSTTHTITPIYAHPVCGTGITVTYQTRICNSIRDIRIIGIEIPCGNNAGCSIQELLEFYEDLILSDIYPELDIQADVRIRFFIVPCWKKVYCTSANSVVWWICSQVKCCFHSYQIRYDCYDRWEWFDIYQAENGVLIGDNSLSISAASPKGEETLDRYKGCMPDQTLIEYTHPCLTTSSTLTIRECQESVECERTKWVPYRP